MSISTEIEWTTKKSISHAKSSEFIFDMNAGDYFSKSYLKAHEDIKDLRALISTLVDKTNPLHAMMHPQTIREMIKESRTDIQDIKDMHDINELDIIKIEEGRYGDLSTDVDARRDMRVNSEQTGPNMHDEMASFSKGRQSGRSSGLEGLAQRIQARQDESIRNSMLGSPRNTGESLYNSNLIVDTDCSFPI